MKNRQEVSAKPSWYKRPRYVLPLVLLVALITAAGVFAYRTRSAMEEVHSISTPPPEVSGTTLGLDDDVTIDTGPARQAIEQREQRQSLQNGEGTPEGTLGADAPAPGEAGGITVLLMGVDARDGESIDIGVRPDSLAVLHIDQDTGACRMLAVPRDSRAPLPGYGLSKINHALAIGGIPYEMLVVEEYLGVELDNHVLVDFAGVETVVDELGGITVENPAAFEMGGQTFDEGTLNLNGEQALLYSRFRGDSEGDFGRISRQQQVLRALLDAVADVNLVKLLPSMFSLLSDHFRTDYGVTDLLDLASTYRSSCTSDSMETRTIPGDVSTDFDDLMQMDLSFVVSDPSMVDENVRWLLMQDEPEGETTGSRLPPFLPRRADSDSTTAMPRRQPKFESEGGPRLATHPY